MSRASLPRLLVLLASSLADSHGVQPPVVVLGQTHIVGSWMTSYGGRVFTAFRSIPYAEPPVGHLRFRNPVPTELPTGLLNATSDPPQCVQKNILVAPPLLTGQEDCLYLNVYRHPKLTNLPVVVYIHGGGWSSGSSVSVVTGPKFLMDRDIVLVTINYRLSIMGFLNVNGEEAPGNAGLKDQVVALRWVRDHVAAFGGDPGAVTIVGQSVGAVNVHLHMLSPMSAGLFHRAISNSGTALIPPALPTEDPEGLARRHAAAVGCDAAPTTPTPLVVACLRTVDATRLVNATTQLKVFWEEPVVLYRPTVETWGPWEERFLPWAPLDIIKRALSDPRAPVSLTKVPWLTGIVPQEGIFRIIHMLTSPSLLAEMNSRLDEVMQVMLELPRSVGNRSAEVWQHIKHFYFPGREHVALGEDTVSGFIDVNTDRGFAYPLHNAVLYYRMAGHKNIFVYSFEYRGMHSYVEYFVNSTKNYGVCHCDDLLYLLSSPAIFPPFPKDSPDWEVVDALVTLWTNFAIYGHPTAPAAWTHDHKSRDGCVDSVDDVWWPPTTGTRSLPYLQIAANENRIWRGQEGVLKFCMRDDLLTKRMAFWDSLPLKENLLQQNWHFDQVGGGWQRTVW